MDAEFVQGSPRGVRIEGIEVATGMANRSTGATKKQRGELIEGVMSCVSLD